ncbi:pyridoxamine 5'-phosphate oxidase family protein [Cellulomonas xylanilytica]|uniref:Pyridoxamine 5'-phosphate oxidase N-terminal domain-containing protein n=1 Tax=Cellulomonas xylanilytica TaxID=233583 RepID=A0A510UZG6_9CELL|nr:pyridoxamine 5'-phosphate oxidase family protein [Cellulomonas xylanilytica]GEK20064.1 hypothetical protein CXY01_05840 [Cellulomonas xylanilytica]
MRRLIEGDAPAATDLAARLATARVVWVATVDGHARPHAVPVWFVWTDPRVAIFTPSGTAKVGRVRANPAVALHLDTLDEGAQVVTMSGTASLVPPDDLEEVRAAFAVKYAPDLGGAPISGWFATFDQPLTVHVERIVSWRSTPAGPDFYVVPSEPVR